MPLLPYVRRAWVFSLFVALLSHLFLNFVMHLHLFSKNNTIMEYGVW
jgi:hypothetical protein